MTTSTTRNLLTNSGLVMGSLLMFACQNTPSGATSQIKIVGGTAVTAGDPIAASTVALVITSDQGTALCTGSLIDSRHVVSAGHCLAESPQSVTVDFGLKLTRHPTTGQVSSQSFLVNQNYNAEGAGAPPSDISLVTLSQDAPSGYTPAQMLTVSDQLNVGETVTLAGFGQTSINDQNPTHLLREVNTLLVNADATNDEIEVGNTPGQGACHGDSGGPAFVNRNGQLYLVGVTSRDTDTSGDCTHNTIYTDVRYYQDWLASAENQ